MRTCGAIAISADQGSFGPTAAALVFGPTAAFSFYRALWHRWHGSLLRYQQELALVLGPFALGITVLEGPHATSVGLIWWGVCAVVGGAIVELTLRSSRPGEESAVTTRP